jgi:hypothetical protein
MMYCHPAVAFGIGAGVVERMGGFGQSLHQGRNFSRIFNHCDGDSEWGLGIGSIMAAGNRWLSLVELATLAGFAFVPAAVLASDNPAQLVPCPRISSLPAQGLLQPTRLTPDEVKAKNRLGCLSPADAVYGADGCPVRSAVPTQG